MSSPPIGYAQTNSSFPRGPSPSIATVWSGRSVHRASAPLPLKQFRPESTPCGSGPTGGPKLPPHHSCPAPPYRSSSGRGGFDPTARLRVLALSMAMGLVLVTLIVVAGSMQASAAVPRLHLNLKEDDLLRPETKPDPNVAAEEIYVEAEHIQAGTERTYKQWLDIGVWESHSRAAEMGLIIESVNCWYSIVQEQNDLGEDYEADPSIRIEFSLNGELVYEENYNFDDPQDEVVREYELPWPTNDWVFDPEDHLELRLIYSGYEDLRFYLDNATYDSGLIGETNFLQVWDTSAKVDQVQLTLSDCFDSDWSSVVPFIQLRVNDETWSFESFQLAQSEPIEVNNTQVNSTLVTLMLAESLPTTATVEVGVHYTTAEPNETKGHWSVTVAEIGAGGTSPADDDEGGREMGAWLDQSLPLPLPIFGAVLAVIGIVGALVFMRSRRQEWDDW